jgi:toxin FitB
MAWLLDTNVLSELRRPKADPKVVAFVACVPARKPLIRMIA